MPLPEIYLLGVENPGFCGGGCEMVGFHREETGVLTHVPLPESWLLGVENPGFSGGGCEMVGFHREETGVLTQNKKKKKAPKALKEKIKEKGKKEKGKSAKKGVLRAQNQPAAKQHENLG
ncbi:hypothetical protein [Prochlorothrix hollandica]|uniref:Uncharacterized protein n=1 Tax=Prochlorothrix hollandica PCC 9006 = CALU 1027 TaxID=317619 RepID=A0A0M2Q0C4_PROHO|nr:hypothetical protein [Prochlorothrix hollandica]KKJ00389.1 hypothetical protein PROH_12140 [Prochlorothrix hollandica PCC 9006 = CALU 1027]